MAQFVLRHSRFTFSVAQIGIFLVFLVNNFNLFKSVIISTMKLNNEIPHGTTLTFFTMKARKDSQSAQMKKCTRCRTHRRICWTTGSAILLFCLVVRRDLLYLRPTQRSNGLIGFSSSSSLRKAVLDTTQQEDTSPSSLSPSISSQTPFPRWFRTPRKISIESMLEGIQQRVLESTTSSKGRSTFHFVHVVDASYRIHSLCLSAASPHDTRAAFWWGRARPVLNFLAPTALQYIQQHPDRFPAMVHHLQRSKNQKHLEGGGGYLVFLANYGDSRQCAGDLPILSLSAPVNCPTAFPVPNYDQVKLALFRQRRRRHQQTVTQQQQWLNLKPQVIWRGSPTGRQMIENNARIQLCRKALEFPHLVDAKLVLSKPTYVNLLEQEMNASIARQIVGKRSVFTNHRAVLDIDGNSWSSRFASLLCSSQVVLKVQPSDVDYLYPDLHPYKHYLPVNANLSNLQEQAEWVLSDKNINATQHMIAAANAWCEAQLTLPQLALDLALIWEAYASIVTTTIHDEDENGDENNHGNASVGDLLRQYPFEKHSVWNRKDTRFRAVMEWKARFMW